ncbi:MAG: cytidylate kinase family protein [Firmicutes bacterium]|nr:cytidylate kinase family protein [Bacillota bacterium]
MKSKLLPVNLIKRLIVFCVGQFILAVSVVLAARSALGASPTTAIPNVIYNILLSKGITNIGLGMLTTGVYIIFMLVQLLLLRKDFKPYMLLEIVVSLLFGYFISAAQALLAPLPDPVGYAGRLVYLIVCIPIVALGVVVYVSAQLVSAPAEGVTAAMSAKIGWPIPKCKLIFDSTVVVIAAVISLLFFRGLSGVREGTIILALLVGPVMKPIISLIQKPLMEFCGTQTKRAAAMAQAEAAAFDPGKLIITVDWEFGSGGDLLARDLAEKLGAKVYSNDEIVGMEIEESGLPERFVTEHEKLMRHSAVYDYSTYAYMIQQDLDPLDELYAAQVRVLRRIAQEEKCAVILGHCGNYILRDDPNCFKLFIHAARSARVARSEARHNISGEEAEKAMHATNRSRSKYHQDFTGEMWGQARYYDMTISTTGFTKPNSLPLVLDAVERWKAGKSAVQVSSDTAKKQ